MDFIQSASSIGGDDLDLVSLVDGKNSKIRPIENVLNSWRLLAFVSTVEISIDNRPIREVGLYDNMVEAALLRGKFAAAFGTLRILSAWIEEASIYVRCAAFEDHRGKAFLLNASLTAI